MQSAVDVTNKETKLDDGQSSTSSVELIADSETTDERRPAVTGNLLIAMLDTVISYCASAPCSLPET